MARPEITPPTAATTRVHAYVARDAPIAVVLRRGPSKRVRMLRWDLTTDTVEGGHWLSGRVSDEKCDVSPDGALFVYFAGKFNTTPGKLYTFTAVCRPPFFTALALWPDDSTYGGGGFFDASRSLVLNYGTVPRLLTEGSLTEGDLPKHLAVTCVTAWRERAASKIPGDVDAAAQHGWTLLSPGVEVPPPPSMFSAFSPPSVYGKANPRRPGERLERLVHGYGERNGPFVSLSYRWVWTRKRQESVSDLGRIDWADWDHDGSLLYAKEGCLFRQRQRDEAPLQVADLRAQRFENRKPAEWASVWP